MFALNFLSDTRSSTFALNFLSDARISPPKVATKMTFSDSSGKESTSMDASQVGETNSTHGLHVAAAGGFDSIVEILLDHGACGLSRHLVGSRVRSPDRP